MYIIDLYQFTIIMYVCSISSLLFVFSLFMYVLFFRIQGLGHVTLTARSTVNVTWPYWSVDPFAQRAQQCTPHLLGLGHISPYYSYGSARQQQYYYSSRCSRRQLRYVCQGRLLQVALGCYPTRYH